MKELRFIQGCPDDTYYIWQTHLWLESLKELGHSDKAISLIFIPNYREKNLKWAYLMELYPEAQFHFYPDKENVSKLLGIYIPILRPYVLMKYFKEHPEMKEKAVFYCDADVIFTEKFNIDKYIDDDISYVSNTLSYINASYFDSKVKDVIPEKLESYKKRDILNEAGSLVGITREIAERNNEHSGGAQYLLKNIDWTFWDKVMTDCIKIRVFLQQVNREFFPSEAKGFQSWCADMWSVLWNLWVRNQEVKIVPEMNFAWSSDGILKLEETGILHNAGIVGDLQGDIPVFYKGSYINGTSPFNDKLYHIYDNEKSKTLCNWYYVDKLVKLKQKYNLNFY